jgi:sensor histidine kinase YesM
MKLINQIVANKWVQHLAFWIVSVALLVRLFAYHIEIEKIDWIYTGLFHLSLLFVVYINIFLLIPRLLKKGNHILYVLFALVTIIAGAYLNHATYLYLAGLIFPGYFFISAYSTISLIGILGSYLIMSTLLHLSKSWVQMQRLEKRLLQAEREKNKSELSALHAQINPHFMMNSLNNLYGLALEQDERTPETILKLSETMQHLLYKTNHDKVFLKDEISFLNQYIDLEKLRTDFPDQIQCTWKGDPGSKKTTPLLLLPLIENAFKHGFTSDLKNAVISILGIIDDISITLTVENKINPSQKSPHHPVSGLGLENLRKRLEILYPNEHELKHMQTPSSYLAQIKFPLS